VRIYAKKKKLITAIVVSRLWKKNWIVARLLLLEIRLSCYEERKKFVICRVVA